MIAQAGAWLVLVALAVQGVAMALTALSSGYDDYAVLRVSGGMGVAGAIVLVVAGIPVLTALGAAVIGPVVALLACLPHSRTRRLFSRGPYADLMASHGCHSFLNAKQSERGREGGSMLAKILCGERFQPGIPGSDLLSGEYIASTVLLDGELCDVNLQAIFGWMPRDPWMAVLTEEEVNAIRFAMRPAPPIEELLAAKSRGEFLIHDSFGETNLRNYLVANHPDMLDDAALLSDAEHNPLQERIQNTTRARALQWAWTAAFGGAMPLVFAWAAIAGSMSGGG